MFQRDEYVYYASGGVCKISDIKLAPLSGMPPDREYYVMHSLHDPSGVIYVPVNSETVFLRRLLTREEAEALLDSIQEIPIFCEPNAKALRLKYIESMHKHDPSEWIKVIKTVYARKKGGSGTRSAPRISDSERAFAEDAKRYLHTELSLALGIPQEKMELYIQSRMEEKLA